MDDSSASAAAQVTLIGENAGAAGAMQDVLLQGFSRYQQRYFGDDAALYEQLKAGQKPTTLVIGCCDSRVHPPALLGTEPGEMFLQVTEQVWQPMHLSRLRTMPICALIFIVFSISANE